MLKHSFWTFGLLVILWVPGLVVWCLTLIWTVSVITVSNISSVPFSPFLSFCSFHYMYYTFHRSPTGLRHSVMFLSVLVLIAFQFWRILLRYPQTQILFSAMSNLVVSPKAFFISVMFSIYRISFWCLGISCLTAHLFLLAVYLNH